MKQRAVKMTTDFPTAPSAYGLNGPSATVTVEKSIHASHTEILTPPVMQFLREDPQMRTNFFNKVSGPIVNKMFECGMIP